MWQTSLAFLTGILFLQNFTYLPDKTWLCLICLIIIFLLRFRKLRLLATCLAGFAYCLAYANWQMQWHIPDKLEGQSILVSGYIYSIPITEDHRTTFLFNLKKLHFNTQTQHAHGLVRLSWQNPLSTPHVGDEWQLTVRLKKVHGMLNPGGFDYEAWAVQEGIRANGYVVNQAPQTLLNSHWYTYSLNRIREKIKTEIENNLVKTNTSPWIVALTVGERNNIAAENWEVLRNTGTNHLMAIAGLHIGFMASFAYAFVAWIWRRIPWLIVRVPVQHAGAIASLSMALIYSAMAGFSIPTQRACLMLIIFILTSLVRNVAVAWHAWSMGLLIVLVMNPLSVLTESFWLSFGAVALIIYGVSGRLAPSGLWWKLGRIQWVIAFGLIPFSIWLFQQCSLLSFIANSVAIPWVGFLVVPLCLLGTFLLLFSSQLGGFVLMLADKVLSGLWLILTWFAHFSWGSWYVAMPNLGILIATCLGVILLLVPAGFPGRYLGLIGLLPLFFYHAPKPKTNEVWLTTLDVGQGLAVVVQTKNHLLVFDTGPKLGANFDMGESVVNPFLRSAGISRIDLVVISHGDNDHIGGAAAILKRFPVEKIKTSVPTQLPLPQTTYCLRGEEWEWDKVNFKFLYPAHENLGLNNDSSCVLQITTGNKSILLTGDIEKFAERVLMATEKANLKASILVAPHHGSKTSAETEFLTAVKPDFVIFSLGYRNRYHFPHLSVIKKYDALGVKKIDTAHSGAIQFVINTKQVLVAPIEFRVTHHHYWNN